MGRTFVCIGLGWGDEGKGGLVQHLTRREQARTGEIATVVRANGGPQASHAVVLSDGRFHRFAQFGSGTLDGARTHLSEYMLVNPLNLALEAQHLVDIGVRNPLGGLTVDRRALVITPFHVAANRLRELSRGAGRHGSCGQGAGEVVADSLTPGAPVLRVGDLESPERLRYLLGQIRVYKKAQIDVVPVGAATQHHATAAHELDVFVVDNVVDYCARQYHQFANSVEVTGENYMPLLLKQSAPVIFEGAQGVLLDEDHGFHPHTTWSRTTTRNAEALMGDHYPEATRIGVLRAFHTRHGAGPFPTEDPALAQLVEGDHNAPGPWQGTFRVGAFDLALAQYALDVCPVDEIALTCLDKIRGVRGLRICYGYEDAGGLPVEPGDLFEVEDGQAVEIKAQAHPTLERQERLGQALSRLRPVYGDPFELTSERACRIYARSIELALTAPVTIASYGPTAEDKRPGLLAR